LISFILISEGGARGSSSFLYPTNWSLETNDKNKIAKNPYIENNNTYIVWKRKTNTHIELPTI